MNKIIIIVVVAIKQDKTLTCESTLRKSQTSMDPEIVGSWRSFWEMKKEKAHALVRQRPQEENA